MMRIAVSVMVIGVPLLAGCSLIFNGDDLRAGPVDAGPEDAGPVDAGPVDAGPADAGPVDAGPVDAGPLDAGCPTVCDRTDDVDMDCDGFCADQDCDDTAAAVHPGAPRICGDGVINDCDARFDGIPIGDAQQLTRLFGDVVESQTDPMLSYSGGTDGVLDAALSPSSDSEPAVLTIVASTTAGIGVELLMGPSDGTPARLTLDAGTCFTAGLAPDRVSVAAAGPGLSRLAFARSTTQGGADPLREHGTARYSEGSIATDFTDGCQMVTDAFTTHAVAALVDSDGDPTSGLFTALSALAGTPSCLFVGPQGCAGGTAALDGPSRMLGAGLGGMMLGAMGGSSTVIHGREAEGDVFIFENLGATQLTGRVDAAHEGRAAVFVAPNDARMLIVQRQCEDDDCLAMTPLAAVQTAAMGRFPDVDDPLVSVTPAGGGRLLVSHRRSTGVGLGLSLVDTRPSVPTVTSAGSINAIRFPTDEVFDQQVASAPDGEDQQIFVVVVLTGPEGGAPDTLRRFRLNACRTP